MRLFALALLLVLAGAAAVAAPTGSGFFYGADGAPMIFIPGGGFSMGRDLAPGERADLAIDTPRHVVDVPPYYIDVHEVTNRQFQAFVSAAGYVTEAEYEGRSSVWTGTEWVEMKGADWRHPDGPRSSLAMRGNQPVVQVSYRDAVAYTRWAKQRLPTEAEWEKAARGLDGRPWPWGFEPDPAYCNCRERGVRELMDVGSFAAGVSPYGLVDMAGNAREWTDSWLEAYPGNPGTLDLYGKKYRVVRGGCYQEGLGDLRTFHREFRLPHHHENVTGFRCAMTPGTK